MNVAALIFRWCPSFACAMVMPLLGSHVLAGDLSMAKIFSDGVVLQRDTQIPVWGSATPGADVVVSFADQEVSATTADDGKWRVTLSAVAASNQGRQIRVVSGAQTQTISDVLVGDVWLCAGQSNMAMRVDLARDAEKEKAESDLPRLRVFTVDYNAARQPQSDVSGTWIAASPATVGKFSACAFFFGRELHRKLDIPIGLVVTARSGSDITAWTSMSAQASEPELADLLSAWQQKDAAYTADVESTERAKYDQAIKDWKNAVAKSSADGKPRPKKPRAVVNPRDHWHHPAVLYNGMIAPIIPFAIHGAIWYQGETNAFTQQSSALYEKQLALLVQDWRKRWGQGEFPMAWVQLPFSSARKVAWARIRESMRRATSVNNTAMVVTLDLGEERLLHPKNKQAFAHRLALWARANVYGEDLQWSGPLVSGCRVGEKAILVRFAHADGLKSLGDSLVGFELLGSQGEWHKVDARIKDDRVVLALPEQGSPTAIRYAWANHPDGNLFNGAGLPASPFEIDIGEPIVKQTSVTKRIRSKKPAPADLTKPPLTSTEITAMPVGTTRLDVYLLMGQSNMKGRGLMPDEPLRDPRIVMMHRRTDEYFLARHPLHLVGRPQDFSGADNAGVGPGLSFAQTLIAKQPQARILLIPCAVGGTAIAKWQRGQRLYDETIRRAKLALKHGPVGKTRVAGALWLQGEADSSSVERVENYRSKLTQMVDDLREDIGQPNLPFIACTIGEARTDVGRRKQINKILLDLPNHRKNTACVDGREFAAFIGDDVHFDTATQQRHGRMFAAEFLKMTESDD